MGPLEVSQICWALATLNFTSERLVQLMSELVVAQLEASRVEIDGDGIGGDDEADDLEGSPAGSKKEWSLSSLTNVAWAFAVMKPGDTRLLSAVFHRAGSLLKGAVPSNQDQRPDNSAEIRSMRQVERRKKVVKRKGVVFARSSRVANLTNSQPLPFTAAVPDLHGPPARMPPRKRCAFRQPARSHGPSDPGPMQGCMEGSRLPCFELRHAALCPRGPLGSRISVQIGAYGGTGAILRRYRPPPSQRD